MNTSVDDDAREGRDSAEHRHRAAWHSPDRPAGRRDDLFARKTEDGREAEFRLANGEGCSSDLFEPPGRVLV